MRVAIVGLGSVSPLHVNALLECGEEIVALCDILPERCEATKEKFGLNAIVYTDYDKMLEEVKPDSVHIVTPHYLHAPMACKALKRGIHVVSEKPCAISYEQLSELEEAVKNSDAYYGVCQQNRYNSSVKYIKEFFANKKIITAAGTLVWRRDEKYYSGAEWRGKWATEGGGVMINQALHTLDLLQWFCGMPKTVIANISNTSLMGKIEVEDTAFGVFKVDDECNFVINATNSAMDSFKVSFQFMSSEKDTVELYGDNIIVNGEFVTKSDGKPLYGKDVYGNGHVKLISDFYDSIKCKREFPVNFYEARKVIALILAMYSSRGEIVDIKL